MYKTPILLNQCNLVIDKLQHVSWSLLPVTNLTWHVMSFCHFTGILLMPALTKTKKQHASNIWTNLTQIKIDLWHRRQFYWLEQARLITSIQHAGKDADACLIMCQTTSEITCRHNLIVLNTEKYYYAKRLTFWLTLFIVVVSSTGLAACMGPSDVVLETKVLVSRRLEDRNKVLVLVLGPRVLVLRKKSWSWSWQKSLENFQDFSTVVLASGC